MSFFKKDKHPCHALPSSARILVMQFPPSNRPISAMSEANCAPSIHHLSPEEQNSIIRTKLNVQRTICSTTPTYVHFNVKLHDHWAAIQITIAPFTIRTIPGQVFYKSSYRYTLCCEAADPSTICDTVQRAYDIYYHPTQWDFSTQYW